MSLETARKYPFSASEMMSCFVRPMSFDTHPSRSQTSDGIFTVDTVNGPLSELDEYGFPRSSLTAVASGSSSSSF